MEGNGIRANTYLGRQQLYTGGVLVSTRVGEQSPQPTVR